jgi:magnesium transporter
MQDDSDHALDHAPKSDQVTELSDIYTEDGSVRHDFLMMVGAAIADRDVIFLRKHVGRLHISELGDVLEAILPEQRIALIQLLGDDFDLAALTRSEERRVGKECRRLCRSRWSPYH